MQTNEEDKMRLNRFSTFSLSRRYDMVRTASVDVFMYLYAFSSLWQTLQQPEANGRNWEKQKKNCTRMNDGKKKKCATLQNVWKTVENAQEKKHHSNYMEFGEGEKTD